MREEFQNFLDYDKYEDLQRISALLARIPKGLEPLRNKFEEHVKCAGQAAISKLVCEGGANDELEPKIYVDALLKVYCKNQHTVQRSFKKEMGFVAALDKACRDFVNCNAATGKSTTKSAELLTKHTDALLRENNKFAEEGDLEDALNQVVCLRNPVSDNTRLKTSIDDSLQVHRRQRCVPDVLHNQVVEASYLQCLCL